MSNLLLYGATSRVKSARENGVRIGLGSDWAVSGSKNLLGELKVARLASDEIQTRLLRPGYRGDGDARRGVDSRLGARCSARFGPAHAPISSSSTARPTIRIEALDRCTRNRVDAGHDQRRRALRHDGAHDPAGSDAQGERMTIGGRQRMVFMDQPSADEVVAGISVAQAKANARRRADAGCRLWPAIWKTAELDRCAASRIASRGPGPPVWFLALDEIESTGSELRPRLPGAAGRSHRSEPCHRTRRPAVPTRQPR